MKYDWLLFDADHTLLDFDKSAEESLHLTLDEFGFAVKDHAFQIYREINGRCWREFEEGRITRDQLIRKRFELFFERYGINHDPLQFHHAYLSKLPLKPYLLDGARDLLDSLSERCSLGLITNGLKEVQRPRLNSARLEHYFRVIAISGEIGYAKPDHAYFHHVHVEMGQPARDRVLVIGDNLHSDIKGGVDFGFHTCWFNPGRELVNSSINPHFQISRLEEVLALID